MDPLTSPSLLTPQSFLPSFLLLSRSVWPSIFPFWQGQPLSLSLSPSLSFHLSAFMTRAGGERGGEVWTHRQRIAAAAQRREGSQFKGFFYETHILDFDYKALWFWVWNPIHHVHFFRPWWHWGERGREWGLGGVSAQEKASEQREGGRGHKSY